MPQKTAIIVGAGPAGLTAAYELLEKTSVKPIVFEATGDIGGISRTVEYKGNRIDIGGHRFFSKSDVVMNWWLNIMPLQDSSADNESESARPPSFSANAHTADTEDTNNKMLIRTRISSIYFLKKFFDYPVSLKLSTLSNLGLFRVFKIVLSYLKACLFPIKNETTLEEFFINRFGKEL
ncbi:MAG: NAD(P)-binding protein, partial [Sedimentisphaerales bacterium]|nr:NAD(P)-binding protein [Sedimentisphaerales bacterium]